MSDIDKLTTWAVELQSLAQAGLTYGNDEFDFERYRQIRNVATEMMSYKTGLPIKKVRELFSSEDGYQTPKIDTRAAVFNKEQQILLVEEKRTHTWSLPGGWCEVNLSVKENCIKEVKEEAGINISVDQLIAVQDRNKHNSPASAIGVCKIFFLCHELSGQFSRNIETVNSQYFSKNMLPNLSVARNTSAQLMMCFDAANSPDWQPLFD